jgi:hypothetical protein
MKTKNKIWEITRYVLLIIITSLFLYNVYVQEDKPIVFKFHDWRMEYMLMHWPIIKIYLENNHETNS